MEDETKQTATAETTTTNRDNGNSPANLNPVERAELAVKRIEEGEKRLDEKIKQLQDLQTERLLGGTAGGSVESPRLTEDQAKKQDAINFWKGTGFDEAIAKHNE